MSVPFVLSNDKITVLVNGKTVTLKNGQSMFVELVEAIKDGKSEDEIDSLLSSSLTMEGYLEKQGTDRVKVVGDAVYVDGELLHSAVADRIADFKRHNLPIEHLIRFVERIADNPSYNSRNQLYDFLEHKDLVITEDGHFLAYKAVTHDYLDKHTHKISNRPGALVQMKRSLIDDDPNTHCGRGLHVGAMDYIRWYGNGSTDKVVIVKVNPENVVSVPKDHSFTKCRVCEYQVVRDAEGTLSQPLYTTQGEPYKPEQYDGDWDFADDDIEDVYDDGEVYSYDEDDDYYDEEDQYYDEAESEAMDEAVEQDLTNVKEDKINLLAFLQKLGMGLGSTTVKEEDDDEPQKIDL